VIVASALAFATVAALVVFVLLIWSRDEARNYWEE
jgi:hypothetical protein